MTLLYLCPFCQTDFLAKWVQVFKSGQSKICGRQPLKNFTWSTLEYYDPSWIAVFKSLSAVWADLYSQPITYGSKYNWPFFPELLIFCWVIPRAFRGVKSQQNMRNEGKIDHIVRGNYAKTNLNLTYRMSTAFNTSASFLIKL